MSKKCSICSAEIKLFAKHIKLKDGYVCKNCLKPWEVSDISKSKKHSVSEIVHEIQDKKEIAAQFKPTDIIGEHMSIDDEHKLFALDDFVYRFEELERTEYTHEKNGEEHVERNNSASEIGSSMGSYILSRPHIDNRGRYKRSLVGAVAGAAIGGAIGSSIDKRRSSTHESISHSFDIEIYLKCLLKNYYSLDFEADSSEYKEVKLEVDKYLKALKGIKTYNKYGQR